MYFLTGFVTNTCCDYFDKILLPSQSGFHKRYSSQHCLLAILENFKKAADDTSYIPLKYSKKRKAFSNLSIQKTKSYQNKDMHSGEGISP